MPQTTAQKIVRHILRWMTPVMVLAALGGTSVSGIFAGGRMLSEQRPSDAIDSPDHRYRVYIFLNDEDGHGSSVIVEHHWHGIHLGQFTALNHDQSLVDEISVKWVNPNLLHIRCDQCSRADTETTTSNWGQLHFSYDLGSRARSSCDLASPLTAQQSIQQNKPARW